MNDLPPTAAPALPPTAAPALPPTAAPLPRIAFALPPVAPSSPPLSPASFPPTTVALPLPPVAPSPPLPPPLDGVNITVVNGFDTNDGASAALIGGAVGSVLLLICVAVVMLWAWTRRKGSYVTNETDGDDEDELDDVDELDDEEELDDEDAALQSL